MNYTPSETRILINYHRRYNREWKDCPGCGTAHQGDGDECSDCIMAGLEERAEAERIAGLECERETLQAELRRHWQRMSYIALRLWKARIEEINEILSTQNDNE